MINVLLVNRCNQTSMPKLILTEIELIGILELVSKPIIVIWARHQVIGSAHQSDVEPLDALEVVLWGRLLAIMLQVGL